MQIGKALVGLRSVPNSQKSKSKSKIKKFLSCRLSATVDVTSGVQFWAHPPASRNKLVNFLAEMKILPQKNICGGIPVKPGESRLGFVITTNIISARPKMEGCSQKGNYSI
jgi:hypothetical protein